MDWIDINEQLPPDNNEIGGRTYIVTVSCKSWKEPITTMTMEWECTKIRNKEVKRWKWKNSIKSEGWIVTHWMELPCPAIN
ncbi:TPA: DUF551 domain-containing protein [Clostridium botulinum]|nr:DUF551 domain-containing protein [Clostridium botulinum]